METICEKVYSQAKRLKGRVAVAVSGGIDSICLLHILYNMPDRPFEIAVITVDHSIRGEDSVSDALFVQNLSDSMGLECYSVKVDAPDYAEKHKISLETSARILRYRVFDNAINDKFCDYVALAHHSDDLCETVLMRIFRGTGIDGLQGIQSGDRYVRPMLNVTRKEIDEYVTRRNLDYREDYTNNELDYSRNYVRKVILESVKEVWPNYRKSIVRLSGIAKETADFLDRLAPAFNREGETIVLNIADLNAVDVVLKKHAVRRAVAEFDGGVDFEEVNLESVLSLIDLKNGSRVDLANNLKVWKEYDKLVFENSVDVEFEPIPFAIGEFRFGEDNWKIIERTDQNIRFDITKIPNNAIIRRRRNGDKFTRFGGITTSLGDFYTDKKVPKRLRDRLPVIAVDDEILVTPVEISDLVKIDDENKVTAYTLTK